MKTNYVDKGVPVIIGEFGANDRVGVLSGSNYDRHRKGRLEYYQSFNFVKGGSTTALRSVPAKNHAANIGLRRDGVRLLANGAIKLFDMNGNLVRRGKSEVSLQGLHQGVYVAKSDGKWLKVNLR